MKYFTAIIVSIVPGSCREQFAKYRNIPEAKEEKLKAFAVRTFPGVHHINLYWKHNKQFAKQIGFKDLFPDGTNCAGRPAQMSQGPGNFVPSLGKTLGRYAT
jgi:hypothetical protein